MLFVPAVAGLQSPPTTHCLAVASAMTQNAERCAKHIARCRLYLIFFCISVFLIIVLLVSLVCLSFVFSICIFSNPFRTLRETHHALSFVFDLPFLSACFPFHIELFILYI